MRRILAVAAVLAGCELAPPEKVPVVAVPARYKEAWAVAAPADSLPKGKWWIAFGDPALDALEAQLGDVSPTLEQEAALYDRARAIAREAESGLFPQLTIDGSLSDNRQSATRPLRSRNQPNEYGANLLDAAARYELDAFHRVHDYARAGEETAQAAAADLAALRLGLQAELASDYVTWRGLSDERALLADTVAAYERAYDLTRTRFNGAIASNLDVTRADTQRQDARAQLADIDARRALVEHAVAALTGHVASSFSLADDPAKLGVPAIPVGLPSRLLERRPDVAAAERRLAAAGSLVGVARAAYYPDFSLSLSGGFNSTDIDLLTLPNSIWTVGAGLVLPLLDGGLRDAQLTVAQADLRAANAGYRATVLAAFQDVEDQLALMRWLGEAAERERRAADAAGQTLRQATILYQDGATDYLDVVVAQTASLSARRASIEIATRQLEAAVALSRALGGGWTAGDLPALGKPEWHAGP